MKDPDTYGELAVLRLLVESVITALPLPSQAAALTRFHAAAEQCVAELLGGEVQEASLTGIQRAVTTQWARLRGMGFPVPPGALPDQHGPKQ